MQPFRDIGLPCFREATPRITYRTPCQAQKFRAASRRQPRENKNQQPKPATAISRSHAANHISHVPSTKKTRPAFRAAPASQRKQKPETETRNRHFAKPRR